MFKPLLMLIVSALVESCWIDKEAAALKARLIQQLSKPSLLEGITLLLHQVAISVRVILALEICRNKDKRGVGNRLFSHSAIQVLQVKFSP